MVQEILRTQQSDSKAKLTFVRDRLNQAIPAGDPDDVRTGPAWELLRLHLAFDVSDCKRMEIPAKRKRSNAMRWLSTNKTIARTSSPMNGAEHPDVARDLLI